MLLGKKITRSKKKKIFFLTRNLLVIFYCLKLDLIFILHGSYISHKISTDQLNSKSKQFYVFSTMIVTILIHRNKN